MMVSNTMVFGAEAGMMAAGSRNERSVRAKRCLDLVVLFLALPFVLPVAALLALVIKFGSQGPVLFRQERVGQGGRRFTCYKFRTMKVDADSSAHQRYLEQLMKAATPMTKMDLRGDSRLIPLGKWIRATGLDELAQLINVWRGEMSWVGPRPCLPYEFACYSAWHKRRTEGLPGLTGLWQVSGKNRTTFEEMIQLDVSYVEKTSVWNDLSIMVRTVPALLSQALEARLASSPLPSAALPTQRLAA